MSMDINEHRQYVMSNPLYGNMQKSPFQGTMWFWGLGLFILLVLFSCRAQMHTWESEAPAIFDMLHWYH